MENVVAVLGQSFCIISLRSGLCVCSKFHLNPITRATEKHVSNNNFCLVTKTTLLKIEYRYINLKKWNVIFIKRVKII